jgi:hypothetical protein
MQLVPLPCSQCLLAHVVDIPATFKDATLLALHALCRSVLHKWTPG